MASDFVAGKLSDGQLSDSAAPIFTAVADATYVKQFSLGVESIPTTTAAVILLWLKSSSEPARFYRRIELESEESADVIDGASSIILSPGDAIIAECSYDNLVDYWISGVEETYT